jgi:hypothetical protein
MKKVLLLLVLIFVEVVVNGQPCAPTCLCDIYVWLPQDSCPGSPQMFNVQPASPMYNTVCSYNTPTVTALSGATCTDPDYFDCPPSNIVTATLNTPPNVFNPMTNNSLHSVYVSLDTIPGLYTYACGADIKLWLRSPAGTLMNLTTTRPLNDGSIPNHYKPTFTYVGSDGAIPLANGISYDLCNYMPEGGLLTFAGENPYASGGTWSLYMNDNLGSGGCTDSARITEFCITFPTYGIFASYTWTADSSNWLTYLSSDTIRNPIFTPPSGYYDITYYVTVTDTVCGCTGTDTVHVSCPNPSSVGSIEQSLDNSLSVYYDTDKQTALINAKELRGKKAEVVVYDEMGRAVRHAERSRSISSTTHTSTSLSVTAGGYFTMDLDCKDFTAGVYIAVVQTEEERLVKRFVKE